MDKPALHIIALPHTDANADYIADAYQQKHRKFCPMMMSLGYDVYSYAGEHSDMAATEHVVVSSDEDKMRWFGKNDHHVNFFNITWDPNDEHWRATNAKAIEEIRKRIKPNDIICIIAGWCQKEIADAFPAHQTVEYGIGYTGVFSNYKVFESYAHMHWVYGHQNSDNGQFYDCVIPNYFDPEDFDFESEKDDYYLFIGRLIARKGPEIAVEATRRLGAKLIMAGQGVQKIEGDTVYAQDGGAYRGSHIEHIGHVDAKERSEVMKGAKAVFVPTTYLEPFGGVSIEAMMCGTPVIASDFGAFSENVLHGISGYRFRTIGEAVYFAGVTDLLDPGVIREYAVDNFSTDRIKWLYDDYFSQLQTLRESPTHPDGFRRDGFYSDWSGRHCRYSKLAWSA